MQTIPFDPRWPTTGSNFSIMLYRYYSCNKTFIIRFQVPQPKPDKKLLAELRRLPPLSEAEGSQSQEVIYSQLILENEGRGLWALQLLCQELPDRLPQRLDWKVERTKGKGKHLFWLFETLSSQMSLFGQTSFNPYSSFYHSKRWTIHAYIIFITQPTVYIKFVNLNWIGPSWLSCLVKTVALISERFPRKHLILISRNHEARQFWV